MPYCKACGNTVHFTSSRVLPVAPIAAGPASRVFGKFDKAGELREIDALGASDITREMRRSIQRLILTPVGNADRWKWNGSIMCVGGKIKKI